MGLKLAGVFQVKAGRLSRGCGRCAVSAAEPVELDAGIDPVVDELAQALIVRDLGLDVLDVVGSDVLGGGSPAAPVAELVVGTVPLGWVGLAATAWGAAGVVLRGDRPGAQFPELGDLGLDAFDPTYQFGLAGHDAPFHPLSAGMVGH